MVIIRALSLFIILMILTGVIYPVGITAIAKVFFPYQAHGTIVERSGATVGSALLAQKFESPDYFHARPSECDFSATPSWASNRGPTSKMLKQAVQERAKKLLVDNGLSSDAAIPADLLFASSSGLDPHISPAAMYFQLDRVVRARGFTPGQKALLEALAAKFIEPPQFGFLGEPRVNVLLLNIAIDDL